MSNFCVRVGAIVASAAICTISVPAASAQGHRMPGGGGGGGGAAFHGGGGGFHGGLGGGGFRGGAPAFHGGGGAAFRAAPQFDGGPRFAPHAVQRAIPGRGHFAVPRGIDRNMQGRIGRSHDISRMTQRNRHRGNLGAHAERRLQHLQQRNRLSRAQRRELNRLQRIQHGNRQRSAFAERHARNAHFAHVTRSQAAHDRFASRFNGVRRASLRFDHRHAWLNAHQWWRLGRRARYVAWFGALYWPYFYDDVFYYTFWPYAYDPGYWAYAYDDFFDGIFFPYGAPYVGYAYYGPYEDPYYETTYARATTGSAPRVRQGSAGPVPGQISEATRERCVDQAKGAVTWPFEQIEQAVQPDAEQQRLLDDLKKAADDAGKRLADACPDSVPMTPTGRLAAMISRLEASLDTVKIVRRPMEAFYNALSDEQKARFNEIGPSLGRNKLAAARNTETGCSAGDKAALSGLPVDRIADAVDPDDAQTAKLESLDRALQTAVDELQQHCPTVIPLTPVGRLEVMQQRLEAMLRAANTVRPALDDFYASLSAEQKAKINQLGRQAARR